MIKLANYFFHFSLYIFITFAQQFEMIFVLFNNLQFYHTFNFETYIIIVITLL